MRPPKVPHRFFHVLFVACAFTMELMSNAVRGVELNVNVTPELQDVLIV